MTFPSSADRRRLIEVTAVLAHIAYENTIRPGEEITWEALDPAQREASRAAADSILMYVEALDPAQREASRAAADSILMYVEADMAARERFRKALLDGPVPYTVAPFQTDLSALCNALLTVDEQEYYCRQVDGHLTAHTVLTADADQGGIQVSWASTPPEVGGWAGRQLDPGDIPTSAPAYDFPCCNPKTT